MNKSKKLLAIIFATLLLVGAFAGCAKNDEENSTVATEKPTQAKPIEAEEPGTGEVKWSEEETDDGWIKVTNEGGTTLGYSKDSGVQIIQVEGYAFKDLNQNGMLDPYENWKLDADTRAADLAVLMGDSDEAKMFMFLSLNSMSTATEIGENMTADLDNGIRTFSLRAGSIEDAVTAVNISQEYAEGLPFGIPIDYRGDTGNSLTSIWPNNLGFAATFDPEVIAEYGRLYSAEERDLGISTVHYVQMDLGTEPRWKRFTGTFGEDPALSRDMAVACTDSLQSSYAEDGTDLGWGWDSINALSKHFPGDGAAEGGRESHAFTGKYNVFPGGQFTTMLIPFEACLTALPGKTEVSAGVMTDFSIHIDADGTPIGGEAVGTAYSEYKTKYLLREQFGWDGLICTDWSIIQMMNWGMEDEEITLPERILKALEADNDRIENYNVKEDILAGFALYEEKYGKEATVERINESVKRLAKTFLQIGMVDNPYLSLSESKANVASADKVEAGFQAQLKSIVMLKNSGNIIKAASDSEKPTVYIPMKFTAMSAGRSGVTPASWGLPINAELASEYYNVVTDTIGEPSGEADEDGKATLTEDDIIRASAEEVADCDFALVIISSPNNLPPTIPGIMFTTPGYDGETEEYIPLSLQYGPYTADSEYVRQESIGGDPIVTEDDSYYGQEAVKGKENRSYYGNTAKITNAGDLDTVLMAADMVENVIVVINAGTPLVVNEFESQVDAIVMHFGVTDKAVLEIVSGNVEPSALLPMQMPANMETVEAQLEDVPFDMECHVDSEGNTYDFTFGLNWAGVIKDDRTAKYDVPVLVGE